MLCYIPSSSNFFIYLNRLWHYARSIVSHEVVIAEHVHEIFEIPLNEVAQSLASASKYQYHKPLNNQAYLCNDAVYHQYNSYGYPPVYDSNKEFQPSCIMLVNKQLLQISRFFFFCHYITPIF